MKVIGVKNKGFMLAAIFVLFGAFFLFPITAQALKSNNFQFDETSIGTSGPLNQSSANYGLSGATGDMGVGNSASGNYQIDAGSKTDPDPVLAFAVENTEASFGVLSSSVTATAIAKFSVLNYSSHGYTIQIFGKSPTNDSHSIKSLENTEMSQAGTEQFGINLVANTQPTSVGSNPDNGLFGFGSITDDYKIPNYYKYNEGDIIAMAGKSSGITNYTITYLLNVAGLTPGGEYRSDQTLIVLGTY